MTCRLDFYWIIRNTFGGWSYSYISDRSYYNSSSSHAGELNFRVIHNELVKKYNNELEFLAQ